MTDPTQAPNQEDQQEARPTNAITSLPQFAGLMHAWHSRAIQYADQLEHIPDGTVVSVGNLDNPEAPDITLKLEGDLLAAFRVGALSAAQLFRELPFSAGAEQPIDGIDGVGDKETAAPPTPAPGNDPGNPS